MPDFRKIVQDRLATLRLDPAEESTLIDELAQHLEDRYQHLLASGETEGEAYRQATAELEDVQQFSGKIRQSPLVDPVPAGDTFAFRFKAVGRYDSHCSLHQGGGRFFIDVLPAVV